MRRQKHRGKHSRDDKLFGPPWREKIRNAVRDLATLLNRGYKDKSALKLVGDRYKLTGRQRKAILRTCGTPAIIEKYLQNEIPSHKIDGQDLCIDGFNALIFVEALISGGYIFVGLDGIPRDIASVHGSYKRVEETQPALKLICKTLIDLGIKNTRWLLDSPVSNSGRLKQIINEMGQAHSCNWNAEVVKDPDRELLSVAKEIVVSSDRLVLEYARNWFNLNGYILSNYPDQEYVVDLDLQITDCK